MVGLDLEVLAAVLGVIVAITVGLSELMRFGPRWRLHRQYGGRLEQEGWQLLELTGPYASFDSQRDAFPTFVRRAEGVIRAFELQYVRDVVITSAPGSDQDPTDPDSQPEEPTD